MAYRTILVDCDASRAGPHRLGVATELARRFSAHLAGVHVRARFEAPMFTDAGLAMDALYRAYEKDVRESEATAQARYTQAVAGKGLSSEWRVADGPADEALAVQTRYADLVVLGQSDPDDVYALPDLPDTVALATGRPVLVVPHIGAARPPGSKVLLAWNASRESARAATDALPFLVKAGRVDVLVIDPVESEGGHGPEPGADAATWLARHGVKVTVHRDTAADSDVGATILSRAADLDSDLIVMGVYGHSRLREMVLGGASRTLLQSMTVPVLMSH